MVELLAFIIILMIIIPFLWLGFILLIGIPAIIIDEVGKELKKTTSKSKFKLSFTKPEITETLQKET